MKSKKIVPLLIICCMSFTSCYMAVSENPLSDPNAPAFDDRLKGLWGDTRDGESAYLHIGKDKNDRTQIVYVSHAGDGSLEYIPVTMFPTFIERNFFMNVRFLNENGEMTKASEDYHFVKYDFPKPDRLSIAFINSEEVGAAIKKGGLVGIVPKHTDRENPLETTGPLKITDRTANIVKFIKSADLEKLFPEPVVLKRIHNE